jgi:hypothetical protein
MERSQESTCEAYGFAWVELGKMKRGRVYTIHGTDGFLGVEKIRTNRCFASIIRTASHDFDEACLRCSIMAFFGSGLV